MSSSRVQRKRPESQSPIRSKLAREADSILPTAAASSPSALAPVPDASERHGAVAPRRQSATPVRRWSVRVYSVEDAQVWEQLRLQLGQRLGRMPSLSEIAVAAGVVAGRDGALLGAIADQLRTAAPEVPEA